MLGLGPSEIAVIVVLALLIFGPSQLPKLGKSLGATIKEFKGAGKELRKAVDGDEDRDAD